MFSDEYTVKFGFKTDRQTEYLKCHFSKKYTKEYFEYQNIGSHRELLLIANANVKCIGLCIENLP